LTFLQEDNNGLSKSSSRRESLVWWILHSLAEMFSKAHGWDDHSYPHLISLALNLILGPKSTNMRGKESITSPPPSPVKPKPEDLAQSVIPPRTPIKERPWLKYFVIFVAYMVFF